MVWMHPRPPPTHLVVEVVVQPYNALLVVGVHRVDILEELDLVQALVEVVLVVLQGGRREKAHESIGMKAKSGSS